MTGIGGAIECNDWISNNNEPPKYDAVQSCHAAAVVRLKDTGDAEGRHEDGWGKVGGSSEEQRRDKEGEGVECEGEGEGEEEEEVCASEEDERRKRVVEGKEKGQASNIEGFWGTNRVRNTLKRETDKRIDASIGISTWRQAYIVLQRRYNRNIRVFKSVARWHDEQERKQDKDMEDSSDLEETAAREASHTR